MVAIRCHPRDTALDERLQELSDAFTHHITRMVKLFAARLVLPYALEWGAPRALSECVSVCTVVPGDLVTGKDDDIRACGIRCGGNQTDGIV